MEVKKKIVLTQSQIKICKMLATAGLDEDQAKAEAEGIAFDYEAEKAKREHEFIMFYAAEMIKNRDWEETRDKAFYSVITGLTTNIKLNSYIRDHVPNLKALRDMDSADILKVDGYGEKTAKELKTLQDRLDSHRSIMPRLNKAIRAKRGLQKFTDEHYDTIQVYKALLRGTKSAEHDLSWTWRQYGG
jgi:hypothetical protein